MEERTLPKFSIIISLQNSSKYLQDCLQSIKSQTEQNYEIIVVNDNCIDSSLHKVKQFDDDNPNIKIKVGSLEDGKTGLSQSKNRGLEMAIGEYIIFIEPEDTLNHPKALSKISECIEENNNPDAIILGYESHWKNKKLPVKNNYANERKATKEYQIGKNMNGNVWSLCLKRQLFESNNIKFMEKAREKTRTY